MISLWLLSLWFQTPHVCAPFSWDTSPWGDVFLVAPVPFDWRASVHPAVKRLTQRPSKYDLVRTSKEFLGVPYVWGGISQDGVDCSGFINQVYAQHGYDLPRVAREQVHIGLEVEPTRLQEGDLVFFSEKDNAITHVGMYVGEGYFIHASKGRGNVYIDALSKPYFAQRLKAQRRVLALPPGRYSTRYGAAVAKALFKHPKDIEVPQNSLQYKPSEQRASLGSNVWTQETAWAPVWFWQLKQGEWQELWPHVGPQEAMGESSLMALRTGTGVINNTGVTSVVLEANYIQPQWDLRIRMAAPFFMTYEKTFLRYNHWHTARDYGKVLREITLGQRGAAFFASLSRDDSLTLGQGSLVRYYTPNAAMKGLPHFASHNTDTTLRIEQRHSSIKSTWFLNDVWAPQLLGGWISKKISTSVSLGASFAANIGRLYGECLEISHVWRLGEAFQSEQGAHLCSVFSKKQASLAGAFSWKGTFRPQRNNRHVLTLQSVFSLGSRNHIHAAFDALYPFTYPLKQAVLAQSIHGPLRMDGALEVAYAWMRYIHVGLLYQTGTAYNLPVGTQHWMLYGALKNIALGHQERFLHLTWGYHVQHFHNLIRAHEGQEGAHALFTHASVEFTPFLSLGVGMRRSSSVFQTPQISWDAMADVRIFYAF